MLHPRISAIFGSSVHAVRLVVFTRNAFERPEISLTILIDPIGEEGDHCYDEEDNQPQDVFVSFPNGLGFYVGDVYRFFCPCQDHLTCVENTCVLRNFIFKK